VEYRELTLNTAKEFSKLSSIFMKVVEIQTKFANLRIKFLCITLAGQGTHHLGEWDSD
jgi:hypothetical protein